MSGISLSNMQIPAEIRGQKIAMSSKKKLFFLFNKKKKTEDKS